MHGGLRLPAGWVQDGWVLVNDAFKIEIIVKSTFESLLDGHQVTWLSTEDITVNPAYHTLHTSLFPLAFAIFFI